LMYLRKSWGSGVEKVDLLNYNNIFNGKSSGFLMKWGETVAVLAGVLLMIQFFYWSITIFDINNNIESSLIFLLAVILSMLVVIVLIEYQNQREIKKINSFLKLDELDNTIKMIKEKRGMIDPRILWVVLALAILFLLWRSSVL
jgi:tetrahydromethanopterin S-methyltransferase subunit E